MKRAGCEPFRVCIHYTQLMASSNSLSKLFLRIHIFSWWCSDFWTWAFPGICSHFRTDGPRDRRALYPFTRPSLYPRPAISVPCSEMHGVKHGVISFVSGVCGVQTLFALTFCVIFALVFAPEFSSDYIALFSSCCTEYTFSTASWVHFLVFSPSLYALAFCICPL